MNFLMRSNTQHLPPENIPPIHDTLIDSRGLMKPPVTTLVGLIAQDSFPLSPLAGTSEDPYGEAEENSGDSSNVVGASGKGDAPSIVESHSDVSEEEGWIVIPDGNVSDDWSSAPDINSLRSLDRSFVFPGEQVHILACLAAYKQDTEIITPFKVAAVMSKNGIGQKSEKQNGVVENRSNLVSGEGEVSSDSQVFSQSSSNKSKLDTDQQKHISATESILRMENHKRQTETLLQRLKKSHFFVRIAESGECLWSKRSAPDAEFSELDHSISTADGTERAANKMSNFSALIDKGNIDANVSGGAARNTVNCCSLPNGDILVILQVNVGVNFMRDPIIEILQFEKYHQRNLLPENQDKLDNADSDPCGELLRWLFPLDNTLPPPSGSLLPPPLSSSSGIGGASQRSTSGSLLFSHFRSYSMSSLPQNNTPPPQTLKAQSSKPSFDLEDWDQDTSQKLRKSQKSGAEGLFSFRGVALEQERFSVRCGLEGIYIPGRRWRRKLQIIQPVAIHSFAADCNTDDLLCVLIQNICPENAPDIVVYIDAITVVFEEASKGGLPSSLPIACIEAGDEHSLPNLALRRGEEHSFILKPVSSIWKNFKVLREKISPSTSLRLAPHVIGGRKDTSNTDRYSIMVSCRCNYTESRLLFKRPTRWRPRISRDLMISVASEMTGDSSGPNERVSQLPVQVLTLRASNLTSEDLTMTVLAPASFTPLPSIGSLSSSPTTPMNPFVASSESADRMAAQRVSAAPLALDDQKPDGDAGVRSIGFNEQVSPVSDVIPKTGLGCTHLWLQSRVPLGCVPAQSTATIKLELLPLTDGIITLDTLQIDVKEKGLTYVPEHSLRINATSSISTGIVQD